MEGKLPLLSFILFLSLLSSGLVSCNGDTKNYSSEQLTEGRKLVMEGRCSFCHTPGSDSFDENAEFFLSGHPSDNGIPDIPNVPIGSPEWMEYVANLDSTVWIDDETVVFSANITPDKKTGIGDWSEETFITTIRTGKHPGWKRDLKKPMPWLDYAKLSNDQLKAIYAYLMSIKPVNNAVPETIPIK